jgi:hypothetical protein
MLNVNPVDGLQVRVASNGGVLVVWSERDSSRTRVFTRRMLQSGVWEASVQLNDESADDDAFEFSLAMDRSGRAIVAWREQPKNIATPGTILSRRLE